MMPTDVSPNLPAAVIFDFDGVILESAGIKTAAFATLFEGHPVAVQYHLRNQGLSRYEKFRFFVETVLGSSYTEAVGVELNRRFDEIVQDQITIAPFVPGAEGLLEVLSRQMPLFVASGTPQDELRRIVDQRGLSAYFAGVYGSPDTKAQIAAREIDRFGLDARDVLFVGDATADYEGASIAGTLFVGRVARHESSPFDSRVAAVTDLADLAANWDRALGQARRELISR